VNEDALTASGTLGNRTNDGFRLLLEAMDRKVQGNEAVGSAAGTKDHAGQRGTLATRSSVREGTQVSERPT
jgi:hypothetical protein